MGTTITGTTNKPVGMELYGTGSGGVQGGGLPGAAPVNVQNAASINPNTANPTFIGSQDGMQNTGLLLGASTVNPADAAASAAAAQNAAKAASLRGDVTSLVNRIKDIFNSRYGQVDAAAAEQTGNLNTRYGNEVNDLTQGITDSTNSASGAFAGRGTRDSSDYGNTVDKITRDGESQVRDLGTGLQDDLSKVGQFVSSSKAGFDAEKEGQDNILAHLAEETNPDNLVALRNQLDAKITSLRAGGADNNTQAQSLSALQSIAPSSARAVTLKTTLSSILGGTAPAAQKSAIANRIISSAGLTPDEQQQLAQAFQSDLASTDKKQVA